MQTGLVFLSVMVAVVVADRIPTGFIPLPPLPGQMFIPPNPKTPTPPLTPTPQPKFTPKTKVPPKTQPPPITKKQTTGTRFFFIIFLKKRSNARLNSLYNMTFQNYMYVEAWKRQDFAIMYTTLLWRSIPTDVGPDLDPNSVSL